jgi:hypothetical protein
MAPTGANGSRYRATYLRRGLDACAAGAQLRLST